MLEDVYVRTHLRKDFLSTRSSRLTDVGELRSEWGRMKCDYLGGSYDAVKRLWQQVLAEWAPLYVSRLLATDEKRCDITRAVCALDVRVNAVYRTFSSNARAMAPAAFVFVRARHTRRELDRR